MSTPSLASTRLVQPLRPAPSVHHSAGKLIDDDDLAVLDDVIGVATEHHIRAQRLVQVMDDLRVLEVVEIGPLEQPRALEHALGLFGTVLGQDYRPLLFVQLVIVGHQLLHQSIDLQVEVRLVVGRAGDDQRRPRLVDQDGVDLVDDRVAERPLHHVPALVLHIVAQIVEAEFIVGAVSDVGGVRSAAFMIGDIGHDDTDGEPQVSVDAPHPFGIAARQIVVHRDDVDAGAWQCVEVGRQRRHQCLALSGAHFGNLAAMQDDAADHLDVIVTLAKHALGGLAHGRERFRQQFVEFGTFVEPLAEEHRLISQLVVRHGNKRRLERGDARDERRERFYVAVVR